MNRVVVMAILCAAAGCTADTSYGFFILRNQVITEDCVIPSGTGQDYRGFGRLDVTDPIPGTDLANIGYVFAPAVVNGASVVSGMPNQHTLFLRGADVELRSDGSAMSTGLISALAGRNLASRTQHFSGAIMAGQTVGVGYPLIDGEQTQAIADVIDSGVDVTVIAHTKVFGTIDGGDATSDPFDFPITVCLGCLVENLGPCASITMTQTIHTGGKCNLLQDALLDCCTLGSGAVQCPAQKPQ
jgi:hypothetical protein